MTEWAHALAGGLSVCGAEGSFAGLTANVPGVVDVCIMCTEAKARAFRPDDKELDDDTHAALKYIGVNKEYEGTFLNIEMNTVPHLQLVQFIESAIKESEPDIIITHHHADMNNALC